MALAIDGSGAALGEDVRVTEVMPGAVRTEFGPVRFEGDEEKAGAPYEGVTPRTPEDVAGCCVRWAAICPRTSAWTAST